MNDDAARTQAAAEPDHFEILQLSPDFGIDLSALEQRFHELQKLYHPDRMRDGGDRAAAVSARLNEAYRTLRSPVGRARCLLSRMGVEVEEDVTFFEPEELQRQFEWRAQLEDCSSMAQLQSLCTRAKDLLDESGRQFAEAWKSQSADRAKACYHRMLFTERLLSAMDEREDQLLEIED